MLGWYFLTSALTLPFVKMLSIGEIPLFFLIQIPKRFMADWIASLLTWIMREFGYSSGSYSPDAILAKPVSVILVYVAVLTLVLLIGRTMRPWDRFEKRILPLIVTLVLVDFAVVRLFGSTRGLNIY